MVKLEKLLKDIKLRIYSLKYIGNKNKIILSRDNNFNNIDIKFSNKLIKTKNNDNVEILTDMIKNFLLVLERDCKNFNSNIFIKNFEKTIFKIENLSDEIKSNVPGSVEVGYVNNFCLNHFIATNHELMHLTSLKNQDDDLGIIYEWYTQLLTERYFGKDKIPSYVFGVKIMEAVETILGKDYLEKLYFNGNFDLIWQKLLKKMGNKTSFLLFSHFNYILELEHENDYINKKQEIQQSLNGIYNILSKFLEEVIEQIEPLDDNNINRIRDAWCSDLSFNFRDEKLTFKVLDPAFFDNSFNSVYDSKNNKGKII